MSTEFLTIVQLIVSIIFFSVLGLATIESVIKHRKLTLGTLETTIAPMLGGGIVLGLHISFLKISEILSFFGVLLFLTGILIGLIAHHQLNAQIDDFWYARTIPKPRSLYVSGIYSHIRHPLYTSMFLFYLGLALIFPSYIIFGVVFVGFVMIAFTAFAEEKFLNNSFREYSEYKRKTGMFLPKLW